MVNIRPPAVAGLFYPAENQALSALITEQLVDSSLPTHKQPIAIIAPHAGYIYSGPIAATAFQTLQAHRNTIKRVVIIGPSHRYYFHGLALSSADEFETPLGTVSIDKTAQELLLSTTDSKILDQAHQNEHCIEVQLPFLQSVLTDFSIIPIVTGETSAESVTDVIELFTTDHESLIVISSDLSHYHDYHSAQQIDKLTSQSIITLDYNSIDSHQACGHTAINGLLLAAKKRMLTASILDQRNSADTAGNKDSVVGYGAYLFEA